MRLNVEEINLLCMVDAASREKAIQGLQELVSMTDNEELQDICKQTARKLEGMTAEEFSEYDFSAYAGEFEAE